MTPDDNHVPVNPILSPQQPTTSQHQPAEQGRVPDALPEAPPVPLPSQEGLSAQEVTALIGGGDASATEANMALEQAQGIDPATES